MREKSNKAAPRFSFIHGVILLLLLVLISCHLVGGIYASYISRSSGGDTGRVVKFGTVAIVEPETNTNDKLLPGSENNKKEAYVTFDSAEVATFVFVEITLGDGWDYSNGSLSAVDQKVTLGVNTTDWKVLSQDGPLVLYKELSPNVALEKAQIFAEEGKITVDPSVTATQLAALKGISLRAIAVQAGGSFTDAETAWKAVRN